MASLSYDDKNNRWLIQFQAASGGRKSLSMKATRGRDKGQSKASAFKEHIENLAAAVKYNTSVSPKESAWIADLPDETHSKLVDAGLLPKRHDPELLKLGKFLSKWFTDREGTKASTVLTWRNAERNLKDYFGPDKQLGDITEDDSENFERWLKSDQNLKDATRRKRVAISKQMLRSAVKARLINQNPFEALKTASLSNKSRQYFVTHEEARKVLDACSNPEWRALVALARYGALRIPSEVREMTWDDVNWAENCLHVHAIKTEHHADEGERIVPLFPELRKHLWEQHEAVEDGEKYVLPNLRHTTNVGPTLLRIIKRAGLKAWPKAWQNMRATRATELENQFGSHKATEWCGHTEKIAAAHYWMVTPEAVTEASEFVSDAYLMQKGAEDVGNDSLMHSPNAVNSSVFSSLPPRSSGLNRARGT